MLPRGARNVHCSSNSTDSKSYHLQSIYQTLALLNTCINFPVSHSNPVEKVLGLHLQMKISTFNITQMWQLWESKPGQSELQLHACNHHAFRKANMDKRASSLRWLSCDWRISPQPFSTRSGPSRSHSNATASVRALIRINPNLSGLPRLLAFTSISALSTSCLVWS